MSTRQDAPPIDVENTKVFDYQQEVIVELHGQTPEGEFEAVSYAFRVVSDGEEGLRPAEVDAEHEEVVKEALAETDYSVREALRQKGHDR